MGLVPSQELEERRKAFVPPEADYVHKIGICGTRVSERPTREIEPRTQSLYGDYRTNLLLLLLFLKVGIIKLELLKVFFFFFYHKK